MNSVSRQSKRYPRLMVVVLLWLVAGIATAQTTYRWVDQGGRVHYSDQPPPSADGQRMVMKKLGANVIDTGGAFSYETEQAVKNAPLTLYTSDTCGENCQRARDLLARRGAPFTEKQIRTLADASEFRAATGYKELVVPVLKAGGQSTEQGFEEIAWNRLLDQTGYPQRGHDKNAANKKGAGRAEKPTTPP
ncbi:MAG: glutaredoxin family protein [Sterolibacterium sp.]|jgi:glutaredoxin|nr:glutaredoxin family protein [Sterolibacterium sp.]